jgi:hypothetical protein
MEYRFSMTPRLIALTLFCGVSLLVLLFTLGFQVGQRMSGGTPQASVPAYAADAKAGLAAASQLASSVTAGVAAATKPVAETAAAIPKPAP